MRRPVGWLGTLAITAVLALVVTSVLVFPRLLHPPLSPVQLAGVSSAEKRVELQQAQARLQNDARGTLLQGIAGLLLVAGAVATWRQVQVNREGQITERFARAVDQLGSAAPDVRLGGIYTLERIAKDSPADRPTVAAVLAALVRAHAPWPGGVHPTPTIDWQLPWLQHRAADVQAAIAALGRHPPSREEVPLYLSRVDLRGAYLPDARLAHASIRHTNLARALMPRIDLNGSDLDDTDLRHANLQQARLVGAKLLGAHLQAANLRGANLRDADLTNAHLRNADLRTADLSRAILGDVDLRGAKLSDANLSGTYLGDADLADAELINISYDPKTTWPTSFQPPPPRQRPLPRRMPTHPPPPP
jgi:hypothetical protein